MADDDFDFAAKMRRRRGLLPFELPPPWPVDPWSEPGVNEEFEDAMKALVPSDYAAFEHLFRAMWKFWKTVTRTPPIVRADESSPPLYVDFFWSERALARARFTGAALRAEVYMLSVGSAAWVNQGTSTVRNTRDAASLAHLLAEKAKVIK